MKKIIILALLVGTAFVSCKKDNSETPTYTKSQFMGKWKQTIPATEGETVYMNFTETQLEEITETGDLPASISFDYTFDGKVIKYNLFVDISLTINELTSTKLVLTQTASGYPGSEQFTYTKVP